MPFELESPAFAPGRTIPTRHTCDGGNLSPPLEWSGAPPPTRGFVPVTADADAPTGVFRHRGL